MLTADLEAMASELRDFAFDAEALAELADDLRALADGIEALEPDE